MRWRLLLAVPPAALGPDAGHRRSPSPPHRNPPRSTRRRRLPIPGSRPYPQPPYRLRRPPPEYACPIWAAEHLAATPAPDRPRVLAAIDAALLRLPATYDTGDGILPIAAQLKAARAAI